MHVMICDEGLKGNVTSYWKYRISLKVATVILAVYNAISVHLTTRTACNNIYM